MPPGLTADLRGISYCPEAAIAAAATRRAAPSRPPRAARPPRRSAPPTSPPAPAPTPSTPIGKIYFAGPFQGAPLSLVAITPALAGPYDYGTVVVRVALHIDPLDAHVVADSETVPQIIGGIPLRMRSIQVNIDKPNFMINPTNCEPFSVASQGIGDQGTAVAFSSYFHAVNCATLAFKPKMSITQLGGRKGTRRAVNPEPAVRPQHPPGRRQHQIGRRHPAQRLRDRPAPPRQHLRRNPSWSRTTAPGASRSAPSPPTTPLLEKPLEGPAYAVSGSGGLPHLAFILAGQVDGDPAGRIETVGGGRLRTIVPVVPDAPIGHFRLTLFGGKHGYLVNTRSLCAPMYR